MSLVPTPMLDTLVQLASNNVNPASVDLNDPAALAMAAVAAMDEEEDEEKSDGAEEGRSDSDGPGALSSASEAVRVAFLPATQPGQD